MTQLKTSVIKRIAIIGAGPSGLATAKWISSVFQTHSTEKLIRSRYLLAENPFIDIVIFEQRSSVGGIWNYTPLPPKPNGPVNGDLNTSSAPKAMDTIMADLPKLNTPMYEGLESNLPHMLMQYSDTPFPKGTQLFPKRETVLQYLGDYASEIMSLIRFDNQIVDVRLKGDHGWELTTTTTGEETI